MPTSILVVEDDRQLAEFISLILKLQGYEAILAGSLEEADKALNKYSIHLIIMDGGLKKRGDGAEKARYLQQIWPVILVSGDPRPAWIDEKNYFPKPFDKDELVKRVLELVPIQK